MADKKKTRAKPAQEAETLELQEELERTKQIVSDMKQHAWKRIEVHLQEGVEEAKNDLRQQLESTAIWKDESFRAYNAGLGEAYDDVINAVRYRGDRFRERTSLDYLEGMIDGWMLACRHVAEADAFREGDDDE